MVDAHVTMANSPGISGEGVRGAFGMAIRAVSDRAQMFLQHSQSAKRSGLLCYCPSNGNTTPVVRYKHLFISLGVWRMHLNWLLGVLIVRKMSR